MRLVIALGGHALLAPGELPSAEVLRGHFREVARSVAPLAREHALVITHGNGPQVGWLARRAEALPELPPDPLDVLDAQSEGWLGYLLEEALRRELPDREIATLLTLVEVDAADPAFARPDKPVGPVWPEARARRLAAERGFEIAPDRGGWRRVVPSPRPQRILALGAFERLVAGGVVTIGAGGGGIPVTADGAGWQGSEAVVDKDRSAALLGIGLGAEALLLLTDVDAVYADWPSREHPLATLRPEQRGALALAAGTMGPKVEAACAFAEATGGFAAIGAPDRAAAILAGEQGTRIG